MRAFIITCVPSGNRPSRVLLIVSTLLLTIYGCSSPEQAVDAPESRPLQEHEQEFDPSKYRRTAGEEAGEDTRSRTTPGESTPDDTATDETATDWVERLEKAMGYRVQLYSTTSIDAAQRTLAQLRTRLDSLQVDPGRLDLGYDAPYYKVRAGDYVRKADADSLRERLHAVGLTDAWVVRDSIIRIVRERRTP